MRLRDAARIVRVPDAAGEMVPLVLDERVIPPSPGTPRVVEARTPPDLTPRYLTLGLLLAGLVVVLRIMMRSRRGAAWGLALFGAAWSLLCGALGVVLLLAWLATKHVFWGYNENLLLLSPLSLLLVVFIPATLLSGRAVKRARTIGWLVAGMGVAALALSYMPGGQENRPLVALFLPVHLALALALSLHVPRRVKAAPAKE
jgi:hypothetical protein